MNTKLHFSSATDKWSTPQDLFDKLDEIYHFDLDVCADKTNFKCEKYYSESNNGLVQTWHKDGKKIWMNPPYGRGIIDWIRKAYLESLFFECVVVCLLPARTDTKWFHDLCTHGNITFLRGRLKFGKNKNAAPFPSMIVIFGDKNANEKRL